MNSVEFLEEVKKSPMCPEHFEEIYSEFQVFQKAALDTLLEIHRVCEKNSIAYQLAYGSLLGLVRDGGQIPWDYDVDVIVPYEEKEKLVEAFSKELDGKFYFYCPESDEKCRHVIMRVAPVTYRTEALHVDVFFFIGTPEDGEERARFAKRVKALSDARYNKLVNIKEESLGDPVRMLKMFLRKKLPATFTNVKAIRQEYSKLCTAYSSAASTYCISADIFATWKDIPSALLWETKLVQCGYGTVRVPVHYEKLLELMYGDYRTVPPLESRIREVINHHRRIKAFMAMK